jgi:RNA polymerase sigma factor (sigma-70 family)
MPTDRAARHLDRVAALSDAQSSDAQLLDAFLASRDGEAFAALVRRYGPMVLGVCRRVLRRECDAEDAFQAAFLVLVRRAAQVRRRASLGAWLYGVAYRTALHARARDVRRRRLEGRVRPMERNDSPEEAAMLPELRQLLDEELSRLPERYRELVVLCDLLGKTKREAAELLRCPEGTAASRLARGRELLRKRLARRGAAPPLAALAAALAHDKAQASAQLVGDTVKAAALVAAGDTAALAPGAGALMEGVLRSMLLTKLKVAAALVLVLLVVGVTTGTVAHRTWAGGRDASPPAPGARPAPAKDEEAPVAKNEEAAAVRRERLRYGGKDFTHWSDVLRTELKPEARLEALKALRAFGTNGYAQEVASVIVAGGGCCDVNDPDPDEVHVVNEARAVLAKIGAGAIPAFAREWPAAKPNARLFMVQAVLRIPAGPRKEAVPLLLRAVKDKDEFVREAALGALRDVSPANKEVIDTFIAALKDERAPVRTGAARALDARSEAAKAAVPALSRAALEDESADVRREAVSALLAIRPEPAVLIPVMAAVLEKETGREPHHAARGYFGTLVGAKHKDAVPALLSALEKARSLAARQEIVFALGQIGPAAKEAAPRLRELRDAKETPGELRPVINSALKRIEPSDSDPPDSK